MTSSRDPSNEDLSINRDNRHQYYETAIASAADADRELREAEARGRERRVREQEFRQAFKRGMWGLLVLVLVAGMGLAAFLMR